MPNIEPLAASVRELILKRLAFTPERQALLEAVQPSMEKLLSLPEVERAYLFGSMVTPKPTPSDVDLYLKLRPEGLASEPSRKAVEDVLKSSVPLHVVAARTPPEERILMLELGRQKYGPDYNFLRILGLAGLAAGATQLAQPKEAEATPRVGAIPYVVAKRLLRDFPVGTVIPWQEIVERHPWSQLELLPERTSRQLVKMSISPLVRKGFLQPTAGPELAYVLRGGELGKTNVEKVVALLRRSVPPENLSQELRNLGITEEEVKKAASRREAREARIKEKISQLPSWMVGFYRTELLTPEARKEIAEAVKKAGVPEYKLRLQRVSPLLTFEEHHEAATKLLQQPGSQRWHGLIIGIPRIHPRKFFSEVYPREVTGEDVLRVLDRARELTQAGALVMEEEIRNFLAPRLSPELTESALWERPQLVQDLTQQVRDRFGDVEGPQSEGVLRTVVQSVVRGLVRERPLRAISVPLEAYLPTPMQDAFHRLARLAESQGGTINLKQLRTPGFEGIYTKYANKLGELSKGTGTVTAEQLRQVAESAPKSNFYLTTTFWTYEPQSLAKVPHDVYQINLNPEGLPDKEKVWDFYTRAIPTEVHPNRQDALTVGWLRVDKTSTPDTWIIEEVQSDLLAFARRHKLPWSPETYKTLSQWAEVGLNKVLSDAREEGVKRVILHTPESLQVRGGAGFGERKLHELYVDLAKRFGFQTGELKASDIQHLQRKFETLPVYLRVPSIIATTIGAGALGTLTKPEEGEAAPLKIKPKLPLEEMKKLAPEVSSAAKKLIGTELRGKTIADVRKGKGNWRYIVFEDGTYMTMDKKHLHSLMTERGRQAYAEAFVKGEPSPWKLQKILEEVPSAKTVSREELVRLLTKMEGGPERIRAKAVEKSLKRKLAARELPTSSIAERAHVEDMRQRLQDISPELQPNVVFVRYKGRTFPVMKEYADWLQKNYPGLVQVLKE
jgi:predicted nucleotidyltransferase